MTSLKKAVQSALRSPSVTHALEGSPGVGKTLGTKAILEHAGYNVTVVSCQNIPIEDTAQLPKVGSEDYTFIPNRLWKPLGGKQAIILDELFKAPEDVCNAFIPLLHGKPRKFMSYEYPDDTIVIATGNSAVFKAGDRFRPHHVNRMALLTIDDPSPAEAMEVFLTIECDARILNWVEKVPYALTSYDSKIQSQPTSELTNYFGYLEREPRKPFCSMRSIELASTILKDSSPGDDIEDTLKGILGKQATASLYMSMQDSIEFINYRDMISDPLSCKVPKNLFDQRMAAMSAASALNKETWKPLVSYVSRLNVNLIRLFWHSVSLKTIPLSLMADSAFNKAFSAGLIVK